MSQMNRTPEEHRAVPGTTWMLRTGGIELDFKVIGTTSELNIICETSGYDTFRFLIKGTDWFDYLMDGRVVFVDPRG